MLSDHVEITYPMGIEPDDVEVGDMVEVWFWDISYLESIHHDGSPRMQFVPKRASNRVPVPQAIKHTYSRNEKLRGIVLRKSKGITSVAASRTQFKIVSYDMIDILDGENGPVRLIFEPHHLTYRNFSLYKIKPGENENEDED